MIRFLDVTVYTSQRSIYKDGNKIKTSTLNFDLLVYFLENPNKVISRDELMQNVWSGRIVSDASVYKQVKRLKTDLLASFSDDELIQTVHGQGFMFVAKVEKDNDASEFLEPVRKKTSSKKQFFTWLLSIPILAVIIFIFFQIKSVQQDNIKLTGQVQRLAILYQDTTDPKTNTDNKAIAQALRYQMLMSDQLNVKLEKTQSIQSFEQNSATIIQNLGYDHVLNMQILPHDHGVKAHVLLRQKNHIFPIRKFDSSNYRELINEISDWAQQHLQAKNPPISPISNMTSSQAAFDNYLQGIRYSYDFENNIDLSIEVLQKAVNQDPQFSLAWNMLAQQYVQSGKIDLALAALDHINMSQVSDRLKYLVSSTRGRCYYFLGKINQAVTSLDNTLIFARTLKDSDLLIRALVNQSYMFTELQQGELARGNLEEALLLVDKAHQKTRLASIYNSFASLYKNNIYDIEKALKYAKLSYEIFQQTGNQTKTYTALVKWASTLMQNMELHKAYDFYQQVIEYSKVNNDVVIGLYAIKPMLLIDMKYGRFDTARLKLDEYHEKLQEIENIGLLTEYLKFEFMYFMNTNNLSAAADFLEQFRLQTQNTDNPNRKKDYIFAKIDYTISTEKQNIDEKQWPIFEKPSLNDPDFWFTRAKILAHNNQLEQAELLFEKCMEKYQQQGRKGSLANVINAYLEFMLSHHILSASVSKWLNVLESFSPPPYPYLKNKALFLSIKGEHKQAVATMKQLKDNANQWWGTDDEALLLQLQHQPETL